MQTVRMKIADLTPADYNPRRISKAALAGLRESIDRFGIVQPVIWNERTGNVVGGHQRLKVLEDLGEDETDVVVLDLPESEERMLNISLNNPRIAGEFTEDVEEMLRAVSVADAKAFDDLMLDDLADDLGVEINHDGETPDVPDPVEPPAEAISKVGEVYRLGDHHLACGDATDPLVVARLFSLGGEPWLMVTDPPYGVNYDPAWRDEIGLGWTAARATGTVANDNEAEWTEAYALFPGDVAYVWHGGLHAHEVLQNLASLDLLPRAQIIWAKQHLVVGRGAYHWKHEPCWYAVRRGKTARWAADRKQTTVWEIKNASAMGGEKDDMTSGHGTQKPLECMARPMRHHGEAGDVVYDPFVGSGTTIVAAEVEGRRCVAVELLPGYVDVARQRWAEFVHGEGCAWADLTPAV